MDQQKRVAATTGNTLKQLNKQVTAWLKTHVDKNPYVFLSPVFKDYERHLKDLEKVRK